MRSVNNRGRASPCSWNKESPANGYKISFLIFTSAGIILKKRIKVLGYPVITSGSIPNKRGKRFVGFAPGTLYARSASPAPGITAFVIPSFIAFTRVLPMY
jgi:hypothetical protein